MRLTIRTELKYDFTMLLSSLQFQCLGVFGLLQVIGALFDSVICVRQRTPPMDWLVGCFGFNGPLRQYFSLYGAVSQREGEREEKR